VQAGEEKLLAVLHHWFLT